jgi:hypothetical protein
MLQLLHDNNFCCTGVPRCGRALCAAVDRRASASARNVNHEKHSQIPVGHPQHLESLSLKKSASMKYNHKSETIKGCNFIT